MLPPSLMVFFHPFPSLIQIVQNIYIVGPASILEHRGLRKSISSVIQSTGPENSDKKRKAQGLSANLFFSAVVAAAPMKRSNRKFMFSSKDQKRERDGGRCGGLMQNGWMMTLSFYCWPNLPLPGHPPF